MQILKRKILLAFLTVLLLGKGLTVFAAGNTVCEGLAEKILFSPGSDAPPGALFAGAELTPGKTITDSVEVRCSGLGSSQAALYLSASGMPDDPAISLLMLRAEASDGSVFYEGSLEKAAGWLWLGSYAGNDPRYITFTVTAPEAMESTAPGCLGGICWRFLAEALPEESPQPKTGDETRLFWGIGLMCFSGGGLALLLNFRRRYTGFPVDFTEEI